MPEGLSAETPTIGPGPSIFKNRRKLVSLLSATESSVPVPPVDGRRWVAFRFVRSRDDMVDMIYDPQIELVRYDGPEGAEVQELIRWFILDWTWNSL